MNTLQEIIKINKEYNETKRLLDENFKELCKLNNDIDLNELHKLDYEEIKSIYDLTKYKFENKSIATKIEEILNESKKLKYPLLTKAHYYPIINEIDFLTDDQKNKLDYVMMRFYEHRVNINSSLWYDLNFSEQQENKILEFLYTKGVISKEYILKCRCGGNECYGEAVTEEEYNKFIQYHSITKEQKQNMSDEELESYCDKWSNEGYWDIGCWEDGGYEICNIDDWNNANKEEIYVNNSKPDFSLDEI